jgi:hypothetical protein
MTLVVRFGPATGPLDGVDLGHALEQSLRAAAAAGTP